MERQMGEEEESGWRGKQKTGGKEGRKKGKMEGKLEGGHVEGGSLTLSDTHLAV